MSLNKNVGLFLRTVRETTSPEKANIQSSKPRRTPGLRREEVAERAGISVDWYTRIEQGRANAVTHETLEKLADALSMSDDQAQHLHRLAAEIATTDITSNLPSSLQLIVQQQPLPTYITNTLLDVLCWNAPLAMLLTNFDDLMPEYRNILWCMFNHPAARIKFGERWHVEAEKLVARFRVRVDLENDHPRFKARLSQLMQNSDFKTLWDQYRVISGNEGIKQFSAEGGALKTWRYHSFYLHDFPGLRMVTYVPCASSPAGEDDARC
ncbi:helix-turn-helix transcriptional regulator [Pantoea allii]|uniref:helix-turn-helix transcriptional regulator n=1 Tax=Pantoea allii TaxID=574096 RepID=UPI0024B7F88D|nr:helix-turn-helix transcriptional regulator [Pantoea allii]MDJ0037653.1 helix-turn-helix transcriptional regulator [Pantoea allii]